MRSPQTKAIVGLVLAGLGYALFGPLARIIGTDFGPVSQSLTRAVLRLAIIGIVFVTTGEYKKKNVVNKPDKKTYGILGFFAAICTVTYVPAIIHLPMGTVMFIFYAFGIITSYVVGSYVYKEKATRSKMTGLILALIGVLLMFVTDIGWGNMVYIVFAMISGITYGLYSSLSKKVSGKYSLSVSALAVLIAEVVIYVLIWGGVRDAITLNPISWIANLVYAADVVGVTFLVFYGFQKLEAQVASLLLLSELVFIILLGIVIYHEIPSVLQMVGGLLIIAALIIPNINKRAK